MAGGVAGTEGGATCGGTLAKCDTEKYVAAVNAAGLCNAKDWRLPDKEELRSLVDYAKAGVAPPTIDGTYFPNTPPSGFWSASVYAGDPNGAWVVSFGYGYDGNTYKSYGNAIRLVRGGQ